VSSDEQVFLLTAEQVITCDAQTFRVTDHFYHQSRGDQSIRLHRKTQKIGILQRREFGLKSELHVYDQKGHLLRKFKCSDSASHFDFDDETDEICVCKTLSLFLGTPFIADKLVLEYGVDKLFVDDAAVIGSQFIIAWSNLNLKQSELVILDRCSRLLSRRIHTNFGAMRLGRNGKNRLFVLSASQNQVYVME
jgi:hypothetical protein